MRKLRKAIYIILGCLSVALGIIGIFVPGLPTTPFLLLSSWLFYKSSQRLHNALHRSRWLGPYILRFQEKKGVPWKVKLFSLICMWLMISLSAFGFIERWPIQLLLLILGLIGTYCVLFVVPNVKKEV